MEEWVREEGVESKCGENESHEDVGLVSRKQLTLGSTLVGCVVRVSNPTPYSVRYA